MTASTGALTVGSPGTPAADAPPARARLPEPVAPLFERIRAGRDLGANTYSTIDVLWVLYDRILRITPATVDDPDRDRFLLSKGHAVAGYYAVLAATGLVPAEWLDDPTSATSRLGGHPDRTLVPGVEIGSGSLGHGLGLGVGTALGLRAQGLLTPRVYVLLGDAELDEGSNHEAIAYAGATGLDTLTAVVIDNGSATHGWPGGIAARFTANGWTAATVDGHDHDALHTALTERTGHRPHVVVAVVDQEG
ncbi:transketolase [Micromonospora fluostatini]|uniref:Transketolase n=1 Tax=Micromonospora fluostatini TaxID=1629071 RepID=A0ABY2DG82_9ACTN|nr:transketolase [Micromonospora fluostatini]